MSLHRPSSGPAYHMKLCCGVLIALLAQLLSPHVAVARENVPDTDLIKKVLPPVQKFFVGNSLDGAIFSTATIQTTTTGAQGQQVTSNATGTIRFTLVLNAGVTFNFNPGRHFGLYTGLDVKNVGYIEKDNSGETVKRRTYNVGAPLGIKLGNMARKGGYLFLGGGIDVPVNYKEKAFVVRNEKSPKFNEWFSQRTPALMPYVFAGLAVSRGATFKVQYYTGNFMNPDFATGNVKPYAGMDVHLLLLSLGFNIRYGKHADLVAEHVAGLRTM